MTNRNNERNFMQYLIVSAVNAEPTGIDKPELHRRVEAMSNYIRETYMRWVVVQGVLDGRFLISPNEDGSEMIIGVTDDGTLDTLREFKSGHPFNLEQLFNDDDEVIEPRVA